MCVITSYSIHYTKLYEDVARVIGVVCPTLDEGNEERRDLKVLCDDVVVSALDSELGGRQQEEEAAAAIAQARITSYNVCYTKLLRASGLLLRSVRAIAARSGPCAWYTAPFFW